MRVIHIGHVEFPESRMEGCELTEAASYPGRWVLSLALAQREFTPIRPEIVVKVVGQFAPFSHHVEGIPVHYVPVSLKCGRALLFSILFDTVVSVFSTTIFLTFARML